MHQEKEQFNNYIATKYYLKSTSFIYRQKLKYKVPNLLFLFLVFCVISFKVEPSVLKYTGRHVEYWLCNMHGIYSLIPP